MADKYLMQIEVPDGKVAEIAERMRMAMKEISACYNELEDLGVVKMKKETASGD